MRMKKMNKTQNKLLETNEIYQKIVRNYQDKLSEKSLEHTIISAKSGRFSSSIVAEIDQKIEFLG